MASAAIRAPTAGANLNPWPEQADATTRIPQRVHRLAGAGPVVDHRRHRAIELEVDDRLARDDDVEPDQLVRPSTCGDDHHVGVELLRCVDT